MNIIFEPMNMEHSSAVMSIFNHYISTSTSAFPARPLPEPFFGMFLKKCEGGYPNFVVKDNDTVIGFCQLSPYNPMSSFVKTAECTYFIAPEYTGKGVGRLCLDKLIDSGKAMGIEHLLAEISSENEASIRFHEANGFRKTGELEGIGEKFDRGFSVVIMQKDI